MPSNDAGLGLLSFLLLLAVVVSGLAALWDLRTGKIPNWLTVGAATAGTMGQAWAGWLGGHSLAALAIQVALSLGGALVCGLVPLLLFRMRALGGGDVKLFAAIGTLCLPSRGLGAETYAFVIALLMVPFVLIYQGKLKSTLRRSWSLLARPFRKPKPQEAFDPGERMWFRLGPAIFLGTLTMVINQFWGP
jgi:prepilin peptidase CpaA